MSKVVICNLVGFYDAIEICLAALRLMCGIVFLLCLFPTVYILSADLLS